MSGTTPVIPIEITAKAPTSAPYSSPPPPPQSSTVACTVEIYPYEGGMQSVQGGAIRSVTVSKSLGGGNGTFNVELANGGPLGPEDPNTWSQIITPMSHVLIGMARGNNAAIVMDGLATSVAEAQRWTTHGNVSTAARGQGFSGADFAWFYNRFNYYALTFAGMTAGITGINSALPQNLEPLLQQGLIGGLANNNPIVTAQAWYKVMAGTGNPTGLLANTTIPFTNGSRYKFPAVVSQVWQNYPNVYIPMYSNYMVDQESWTRKFNTILPHPWYEFFVTTAPSNVYAPLGATQVPGKLFTMQTMPYAPPAGPVMVARVNPLPFFGMTNSAFTQIDTTAWNALPLTDFTTFNYGFHNSSVAFAANATNFYQLNPTWAKLLGVGNNAGNIPIPFWYIAAADTASIQRYGFSPSIASIEWMCDPQGTAAQGGQDITATILALTGRYVSYHHPIPLMLRGTVTIPLTPDIFIGTRFRYKPYKDTLKTWDFYVEGVSHKFVFGGECSTTLTLSRGLPTDVYSNASLLQAICTGNAQRANGVYTTGLPSGSGAPLQVITTQTQAATLTNQLATPFVTPQALNTPPT